MLIFRRSMASAPPADKRVSGNGARPRYAGIDGELYVVRRVLVQQPCTTVGARRR